MPRTNKPGNLCIDQAKLLLVREHLKVLDQFQQILELLSTQEIQLGNVLPLDVHQLLLLDLHLDRFLEQLRLVVGDEEPGQLGGVGHWVLFSPEVVQSHLVREDLFFFGVQELELLDLLPSEVLYFRPDYVVILQLFQQRAVSDCLPYSIGYFFQRVGVDG